MLGAVYTHYVLGDKFERMAPGLVFALLLLTRLIIHRQVTQRDKGTSAKKIVQESGDDNQEEESESDKEEEEEEEKPKASKDKKKDKKNK